MEIKLNLASKTYLNRQNVRMWLLLAASVLVVLLFLNLVYGYRGYQHLRALDSRLAELNLQVADVKGVPADYSPERYKAVKAEISLAKEIIASDQFHWTEILSRFEKLVPEDVSVRSIQPNYTDRSVRVEGIARNVSAMTTFMDRLLTSDDLHQAFLQQHGEVEVEHQGVKQRLTGFSLVIRGAF